MAYEWDKYRLDAIAEALESAGFVSIGERIKRLDPSAPAFRSTLWEYRREVAKHANTNTVCSLVLIILTELQRHD